MSPMLYSITVTYHLLENTWETPLEKADQRNEALLLAYSFSLQRFMLVIVQQCALTDLCPCNWWHLISALNTGLYHQGGRKLLLWVI